MARTNRRYGPRKPSMSIQDRVGITIIILLGVPFFGGMVALYVMRILSEVGGY